jgi:hypothetical protein
MKLRTGTALATLAALLAAGAALAQSSASFNLTRHVIAGGGGLSASASYVVQGTIGQAESGPRALRSGSYSLVGGYWAGPAGYELIFLPLIRR